MIREAANSFSLWKGILAFMVQRLRVPPFVPSVIILGPPLVFFVLKLQPAWDPLFHLHVEHFYVVSTVAPLAAVAVAVGRAGRRLRNLQVIMAQSGDGAR